MKPWGAKGGNRVPVPRVAWQVLHGGGVADVGRVTFDGSLDSGALSLQNSRSTIATDVGLGGDDATLFRSWLPLC